METIRVLEDPKKEVKFWLEAMKIPNLDKESLALLNKCLQMEIKKYMTPVMVLKRD